MQDEEPPQYRDPLDEVFDAIVVGTGLTEALLAAALARIGKRVLHLDANQYYGDRWAAFTLDSFCEWAEGLDGGGEGEGAKAGDAGGDGGGDAGGDGLAIEQAVAKFIETAGGAAGKDEVSVVKLSRGGPLCSVDFCGALLPRPSREELRAEREARERVREWDRAEKARREAAAAAAAAAAPAAAAGAAAAQGSEQGDGGTGKGESEGNGKDKALAKDKRTIRPPMPPARPQTLVNNAREFNLDLRPALALCKGPMVDVLVSSDVAESVEFVTLEGVFVGLVRGVWLLSFRGRLRLFSFVPYPNLPYLSLPLSLSLSLSLPLSSPLPSIPSPLRPPPAPRPRTPPPPPSIW